MSETTAWPNPTTCDAFVEQPTAPGSHFHVQKLLDLAVKEFERGLVWIGAQNDSTAKGEAEAALRLADTLGTTPAPDGKEVAAVFESFGTAVATLGVQLAPPKPT